MGKLLIDLLAQTLILCKHKTGIGVNENCNKHFLLVKIYLCREGKTAARLKKKRRKKDVINKAVIHGKDLIKDTGNVYMLVCYHR